jgi:hypothetical protein
VLVITGWLIKPVTYSHREILKFTETIHVAPKLTAGWITSIFWCSITYRA